MQSHAGDASNRKEDEERRDRTLSDVKICIREVELSLGIPSFVNVNSTLLATAV